MGARLRALRPEHWFVLGIGLSVLVLLDRILIGRVHLYGGKLEENRLYLLSSLPPALAGILALLVTASLVATTLAAQSFTPRIINYRMRDPWIWAAIALYITPIGLALASMADFGWFLSRPLLGLDLTLLTTAAALAFLFPFTLAVLRSLETDNLIRYLIRKEDYRALEDLMRKATNEGIVRNVEASFSALQNDAKRHLTASAGNPTKAKQFADLGLRLGRFAAAEKHPEAIVLAMDYLTGMTGFCTRRVFRGAADLFNESVTELQQIAEEAFANE